MEDNNLHLVVVTQKRVRRKAGADDSAPKPEQAPAPRAVDAPPAPQEAEPAEPRVESGSPAPGGHAHHSHHRHYSDYGTTSLGSLGEAAPAPAQADQAPEASQLSRGETQRAFFDKYDQVLNRRYSTRNRSKTSRILVAVLILLVTVVLLNLVIGSIRDRIEETLEKPLVDTVPFVTLDLGES